jgi:hypothetical protein
MQMAAKKRPKKVKYAEFLAWLEGVESMQDPSWIPSATQWKTIRAKLDTVIPNVEVREIEVEHTQSNVITPASAFMPAAPLQVPHAPVQLQANPNQLKPSEFDGVPASNNGPFVDANGHLPAESEFL